MAGGMDLGTGGKGGKKALDTTINLVPFIDLMAVTIVFLIMTAVWTQIERLQVTQSGQAPEPPTVDTPSLPLTLLVTEKELTLQVGTTPLAPIAVSRNERGRLVTEALALKLRELKRQQPELTAVTLTPEDGVRYDDLVRLIDVLVQDGEGPLFPSVQISGVGS